MKNIAVALMLILATLAGCVQTIAPTPATLTAIPTATMVPGTTLFGGVQPPRVAISTETIEQVTLLHTLTEHTDRVTGLAFSANGHWLASSSRDGTLKLWDTATWQVKREFNQMVEGEISFSPDGTLVASARDGKLWDIASGAEMHSVQGPFAFAPDGKTLAVADPDGTIHLQRLADGQEIRAFEGYTAPVHSLVFSPDGRWLASSPAQSDPEQWRFTVRIWDVAQGQIVRELTGHRGDITAIAFSPDGKRLASASIDYTVEMWDIESGELLYYLVHNNGQMALAFSPDGTLLASPGDESGVKVRKVQGAVSLRNLKSPYYNESLAVAFSPDGMWLASGSYDNEIYLWGISSSPTDTETLTP